MVMKKQRRGAFGHHGQLVNRVFTPTAVFTPTPNGDPGAAAATTQQQDTAVTPATQQTTPTTQAQANQPGTTIVDNPDTPTQATPIIPGISISDTSIVIIPTLDTTSSTSLLTPTTTSSTTITTPTTSSTALTTSTTPTTTALATTSRAPSTVLQTVLASPSHTTSAAPSSSAPASSGASSTGTIVGGVGGGIIGLALICAGVAFLLRRYRRSKEEPVDFDPTDFRRSAVMLDDPPTHEDTIAAGFNPRAPPPMSDRERPATFGTMYGNPGPAQAQEWDGYNNAQQGYGAPQGQQWDAYNNDGYNKYNNNGYNNYNNNGYQGQGYGIDGGSPPMSATSANPFFTPAPYNQSPFSPVASPVSPSHHNSLHDSALSTPQVFTRTSSASVNDNGSLSRQPSSSSSDNGNGNSNGGAMLANEAARRSVPLPSNDYVDLSRSSVTPFQEAQYVEISKRLSSEVPKGLDTAHVEEFMANRSVAEVPEKELPNPVPAPAPAPVPMNNRISQQQQQQPVADMPVPPTPVPTRAERVTSIPPMLPELNIAPSRNSNYDFPASVRGSVESMDAATVSVNAKPAAGPSPLANVISAPKPAAAASPKDAAVNRPETVYDPEDAYGGF